ncbi:MAG: B12-binding domain-containing radical SAM protein [Armatimonadetes bacterium]|nr:B12-binding domain-containing radical SAM protein [Armatimonadota bacterium]
MRAKLILPALTEAKSPFFRPVKYSLFPPLGLATLAGYLDPEDAVTLTDEHVEQVELNDDPELVAIQVYITSARRAYELADHYRARGAHVCLGGPHVTSLPREAAQHADTVFLGPGEDTWPRFLADFRAGAPARTYRSRDRTLAGHPLPRRDLIKRHLYLTPNVLVASRGCPHSCDFCYKTPFFAGGKGFYTWAVEDVLTQVESLPGRHLYFLDDHFFGNARFAAEVCEGLVGMGRVWQAGGTVQAALDRPLMEVAAKAGLRSLFIGFETLSEANLRGCNKPQNLHRDYEAAIRQLRDLGIMVNASFVYGMDEDDASVFERTVEWAVRQGVETATFHILTPYPGTKLHWRLTAQGRILSQDWDLYDTRHAVFQPVHMSAQALEDGYWQSYRDFYRWSAIFQGAWAKTAWPGRLRHLALAGGWKKAEPIWDLIIRARRLPGVQPALEALLDRSGRRANGTGPVQRSVGGGLDLVEDRLRGGGQGDLAQPVLHR